MTARRKSIAVAIAAVVVLAVLVVAIANGDGGGSDRQGSDSRPATTGDTAAFAWLHPGVLPAGWTMRRLPASPARLPAPPGWRPEESDPGTRTMVSRGPSGHIVGYLNATPLQGDETAANWSHFRVTHNRGEGDSEVRLLAAGTGLRFRAATGSCVIDSYASNTGNRFREIACLVSGRSATTVIVAAAPPSRWTAEAPLLERAVSNYIT